MAKLTSSVILQLEKEFKVEIKNLPNEYLYLFEEEENVKRVMNVNNFINGPYKGLSLSFIDKTEVDFLIYNVTQKNATLICTRDSWLK